ncbi:MULTISPECIES: hypothetical protein [Chitinophagaceae]
MQNDQSTEIIKRFISIINELVEVDILHGKKSFTDHYNINRWNFSVLMREPWREIFQINWLAILCKDFGVNADWLLLGVGERYNVQFSQLIKTLKEQTKEERKNNELRKAIALPRRKIGRPKKEQP